MSENEQEDRKFNSFNEFCIQIHPFLSKSPKKNFLNQIPIKFNFSNTPNFHLDPK